MVPAVNDSPSLPDPHHDFVVFEDKRPNPCVETANCFEIDSPERLTAAA